MAFHAYTDGRKRLMRKSLAKMRCDQQAVYQVILLGRLGPEWADLPGNLDLQVDAAEDGVIITVLSVKVMDQAALHGLLQEIRDLGITLLLVEYMDSS